MTAATRKPKAAPRTPATSSAARRRAPAFTGAAESHPDSVITANAVEAQTSVRFLIVIPVPNSRCARRSP